MKTPKPFRSECIMVKWIRCMIKNRGSKYIVCQFAMRFRGEMNRNWVDGSLDLPSFLVSFHIFLFISAGCVSVWI